MATMRKEWILLLAALSFAACKSNNGHSHEGDHDEYEEHEVHHSGEIVFDEHRQEMFGIVCGQVKAGPFTRSIKAGGRLVTASNDEVTLVAPASGIVRYKAGGLTAGMSVSRGTMLASIWSDGVAGGDRIAKARAAFEAARAEYERDSALVRENIVTALHYEESRLAYTNARLELEALSGGGDGPIEVRSGFSGKVERVLAGNGKYVEAGQPVVTVSAGRMLELQVDVPSGYASALSACKDARFLTPAGSAVTVSDMGGHLLGSSQNATDGYLTISFAVPQSDGLVGGVYTDVWLLSGNAEPVISVPSEAVIEEQGITSVFVRLDEDCFEKREVVLGGSDGVRYEILGGLDEGDDIVLKGAMHIKLASFQAIPHGHSHNH